jgi:ribokinase
VDVAGLQRGAGASGMSVAIVARDGAYQAVVVSGENRAIDADAIRLPPDCRAVLMQNEVDPRLFAAIGVRARSAGARLMVNAAPAVGLDPALLAPADDVIVNRVEACDLLGSAAGSDPRALVAALQGRLPGVRIVVTLGAEGVAFSEPGAAPAHAPALRAPVVSTHGAGDVFVGAMAAATLRGAPLDKAVAAGQTAAAAHVSADPSSL